MDSPVQPSSPCDEAHSDGAEPAQDFDAFLAVFDAAWGFAPRSTRSPPPGLQPSPLSLSSPEPLASASTVGQPGHRTAVAAVSHTAAVAVSILSSSPPHTCISAASTTVTTTTTAAAASLPVSARRSRAHGRSIVNGDGDDSDERSMAIPLPMTPPPPHGPISAAKLIALGGNLPAHLSQPTPALPTPTPVPVASKAIGSGATRSDFASVFFSPIPLSYLSIARSESHDSILAQSVGSPTDATLRGGRLSTAALNSDWAEEAEALSAASALSALQRTRSGSSSSYTQGESGAESGAFLTPLLQTAPSGDTPRKSRLAALTAAVDAAAGNGVLTSPSNSHHSAVSLRSHAVGSHSSTSPDSVLSSEVQLPSSSSPGHNASPSRSSPITCSSATSALHPLLSRASAVASSLSSSPAQTIPRALGGALGALPDDLLPAMANTDLMHSAGISIAAAAASVKSKGGMLRLVAGTAMIPHIDKVDKGGEDAYCVSHRGLGAIGVADGVSGWAEEGIDPAAYSRSLMRYTSEALQSNSHPNGADPREVIRYAHMATVMAGSSTICVAVMKPCGQLQVANLGDSGVRLIRDGKVVFASTAQQHMFNMPFQLSHPSIIESPDDADSADVNTLDVMPGDIVVLATDGLYDNMFDEEIGQICIDTLRSLAAGNPTGLSYSSTEAEIVAGAVARTAHAYARNAHQRTPWSVAASETGLPWAKFFTKGGGKMDDVTVVVGFVVADTGR